MQKPKNKSRAVARSAFKNAKAKGASTDAASAIAGKMAQKKRSGKMKGSK